MQFMWHETEHIHHVKQYFITALALETFYRYLERLGLCAAKIDGADNKMLFHFFVTGNNTKLMMWSAQS